MSLPLHRLLWFVFSDKKRGKCEQKGLVGTFEAPLLKKMTFETSGNFLLVKASLVQTIFYILSTSFG